MIHEDELLLRLDAEISRTRERSRRKDHGVGPKKKREENKEKRGEK
jgi:hypothetical protein